ncbi:hypothetical protein [Candidatus Magnetomonas plexicatena]|uniref:hypothetical protein n=1 Tax=Candidatus Magnetomonas plexicatena TaxID=2552947 RepID=UPI001C7872CC|nr:hypothetical protein E2O03_012100 [Nitrospirales bacterium LBB_01]
MESEEKIFHDWLLMYLKQKLSREYTEVLTNFNKENKFEGMYPDLILNNYGMTVGVVVVETDSTITAESAKRWKQLSGKGVKLIVMVPERAKQKVMGLLWDEGIAGSVALGGYELKVNMP